jgi:hypothetical protein
VQGQAAISAAERHPGHRAIVEAIIDDLKLSHVFFDISWDDVAKYAVVTPDLFKASRPSASTRPTRSMSGPAPRPMPRPRR